MKKEITCIICPRGCALTVDVSDNITVSGNACKRGETYAVAEITNPQRTVTGLVRVKNREDTMLSVKTKTTVPKDKMLDVMQILKNTSVNAPVNVSDVILDNCFGTEIIATKSIY